MNTFAELVRAYINRQPDMQDETFVTTIAEKLPEVLYGHDIKRRQAYVRNVLHGETLPRRECIRQITLLLQIPQPEIDATLRAMKESARWHMTLPELLHICVIERYGVTFSTDIIRGDLLDIAYKHGIHSHVFGLFKDLPLETINFFDPVPMGLTIALQALFHIDANLWDEAVRNWNTVSTEDRASMWNPFVVPHYHHL